jgi:thiamine-monophosphate kinase
MRRADALRWGEDYQLLFTLTAGAQPSVTAFRIGVATASGAAPIMLDGRSLDEDGNLGYEHG